MHSTRTPITDRKVRFALAGCGRIAANHFGAMSKHAEHCEIVDVCDVDPVALDAAVTLTRARGHRRYSDMLTQTKADVIVLTTPCGMPVNLNEFNTTACAQIKSAQRRPPIIASCRDQAGLW